MAVIKPFKALRPQAQLAKQVASRPYDVLTSKEAKVEAQGNPNSFLHITKSEIDLPENINVYSAEVYERAKENLDAFIKRDILFHENKDCYYIYRLIMNGHSQTGLVCLSALDDYETNVIKKHEYTRPDKEKDRIEHIIKTGAQTGNVFLAYKSVDEIDELIHKLTQTKTAVYDFCADDNVQHTIWIVGDNTNIKKITSIFAEKIPNTYIADGHHRAASADKARAAFNGAAREAGYFLTTLFPSAQLQIMDYNRIIKDLNGLSSAEFLQKLEEDFSVKNMGAEPFKPQVLHEFGMYLENSWYRLKTRRENVDNNNIIQQLDITILENTILKKLLNIQDQRTDKRIDFIGGIRGLYELENSVNCGEWKLAFSLHPVSVEQLFAVADSGNVMPPKSTWFEPKLRDGLLTHLINE